MRGSTELTFVLVLAFTPGSGCGYSRKDPDQHPDAGVDASVPDLDAAADTGAPSDSGPPPDAGCGVVDPCPPDDPDGDDDGIPDGFDREPDEVQETVEDEDFAQDPGWEADGEGTWSWTPEGWAEQSAECDDRGTASTFEPAGELPLEHLYVEAKVRVPACPGQTEGHGAGVFVRRADGRLLACLFSPTTPEEDAPEDTSGHAGIEVVIFDGEELAGAVPDVLGSQANDVPTNDEDSSSPGPHWGEKWVTVRLLVDAFDVVCEARPGERFDSWGIVWQGTSPDLPAGTAGLLTWGASAAFDDFLIVALDAK